MLAHSGSLSHSGSFWLSEVLVSEARESDKRENSEGSSRSRIDGLTNNSDNRGFKGLIRGIWPSKSSKEPDNKDVYDDTTNNHYNNDDSSSRK